LFDPWEGHDSSTPGVDILNFDEGIHYLSWENTGGNDTLNISAISMWPHFDNESAFNDSTELSTIVFTGNENHTIYVKIPQNATVTSMNITLNAYE